MGNKTVHLTYNKGQKDEFCIKVEGYYSPPERAVFYPADRAQPESDGDYEIDSIELTSGKLTDLLFDGITIESIMERCLEELDSEDGYPDFEYDYDED